MSGVWWQRERMLSCEVGGFKGRHQQTSEIQEGVLETGRGVFAGVEDGQSKLGCATGVRHNGADSSRVLPVAETAIAAGAALPQRK